MKNLISAGAILALTLPATTWSGNFHPLEEIRHAATRFASQQLTAPGLESRIESGHLDPRLRLPRCSIPLESEPLGQQRNGPNITVTVKCRGESPWSVHVPVRISTFAQVYVALRPLPRGVPIEAASLGLERRETGQLRHGYIEEAVTVAGRSPRRAIPQGATLSPRDLEQEQIIQRGQQVTIVASSGPVSVRMPGKALDSAAEGEIVKVQNVSSNRVIEATALRPGVVEVKM